MDPHAFLQAIADDPEDELLRLAFADWLEEQGQPDRAEFVRASCALARVTHRDPEFGSLVVRASEAFRRCRPPWWKSIQGVSELQTRGLIRLHVRSQTAARRLGKAHWLGQAHAEGWLERIEIPWSDDRLAQAVAGWKGPIRDIPLLVRPAPQITDVGLAVYLDMPGLVGLELPGHALRNQVLERLSERQDLRELALFLTGLDSSEGLEVLEQVGKLTGLRQLKLHGTFRPNDEDLARWHGLDNLRWLILYGCHAVTEAGVAGLQQALPSLAIERR
jgi:uncharacterized protein (TIGR02996 family)